ncbi:MAG: Hsp20/alpha crystallin family protein [Lentisphaeria bacterium]|nr:Hsp20/alpha crystallin family protein [Lentisphaeria bacterium]
MEKDTQEKSEVQVMPDPVTVVPLVDILENGDGVTLIFEVPGANSGTVDIEVLNSIMTMSAKSSLRRNGRPVLFKRNFRLSEDVDVKRITARTKDGVLTLEIPKAERAKVHKVKVQ